MLMANVVRLSDRFLDRTNPESMDRQERLFSCMVLVSIFYVILSIAFVKMGELEKKRRVFHPDPDVCYELMIAPPEATPMPVAPPAPSLLDGRLNAGGKSAAAMNSSAVDIPAIATPNVGRPTPAGAPASAMLPVSQQAPVAVVSSNAVRPVPAAAVATSATAPVEVLENHGNPAANFAGADASGRGSGGNGVGEGIGNGAGEQQGFDGGPKISTAHTSGIALGNIGPYRKAMLIKIAGVWRPSKKNESVVIGLRIAQDGTLIESWIMEQSSAKAGKAALRAVQLIQFDALPEWYHGEELSFKVNLDGSL